MDVEVEYRPIVPPGDYQLCFVHHITAQMFGKSAKVGLLFRIVNIGSEHGMILPRWYAVKRLKGRPSKNGNFVPKKSGDFIEDFFRFQEHKGRLDRLPMGQWRKGIYIGAVETVNSNYKGEELPQPLHYSVIRKLKAKSNG